MLDSGAEIDAKDTYWTALHNASRGGHAEFVGLLLERGVCVCVRARARVCGVCAEFVGLLDRSIVSYFAAADCVHVYVCGFGCVFGCVCVCVLAAAAVAAAADACEYCLGILRCK